MKVLILQACTLGKSLHFLGNMIHLPVTGTRLVSDKNRLGLVPALEELEVREGEWKDMTYKQINYKTVLTQNMESEENTVGLGTGND